MKLARYMGGGRVAITDEPAPVCPEGGILVKASAAGLCSGELMSWYMDQKIPHVLGHETSGKVIESNDPRFPVGCLVSPHHHAPCMKCEFCLRKQYVHCPVWKRTKLEPGGLAEVIAVPPENLTDCHRTDGMPPELAALLEPLACVAKSLRMARRQPERPAVIGLGFMGLLHMKLLGPKAIGYEINEARRLHASSLGMDARHDSESESSDVVFVCPGSPAALEFALQIVEPMGTVVLFAPFGPGGSPFLDLDQLYFRDITLATSYSAGPDDCLRALELLRESAVIAKEAVSDFITLDELPEFYVRMKNGEVLKPMVMFS